MLKRFLFGVALVIAGASTAQTDSTDLDLYMSDAVLETALDSMLYDSEEFELLNLDFTVSDTIDFSKVHVELRIAATGELIFKKVYSLSDLESAALISDWDIAIPFGNLLNTQAYQVAIITEHYDGSLEPTITKTLTP
jgi:hypothetical protein